MDRHLISADELRAAGALDVPPEWRKSLGGRGKSAVKPRERLLFDDMLEDEDALHDEQSPDSIAKEETESAESSE